MIHIGQQPGAFDERAESRTRLIFVRVVALPCSSWLKMQFRRSYSTAVLSVQVADGSLGMNVQESAFSPRGHCTARNET